MSSNPGETLSKIMKISNKYDCHKQQMNKLDSMNLCWHLIVGLSLFNVDPYSVDH